MGEDGWQHIYRNRGSSAGEGGREGGEKGWEDGI